MMHRLVNVVRNTTTGRFHPFIWRLAPLPGGGLPGPASRYKSAQHHTAGFESFDEALAEANRLALRVEGGMATHMETSWGEDEVPAMVQFFGAPQKETPQVMGV